MGPVEQALFLIDRLYPEMPAVHRMQIEHRLRVEHDAGRWHGPQRLTAASRQPTISSG